MTDSIARLAVIVAMSKELQHLPGLPAIPDTGASPWRSVAWRHGDLEVTAIRCGIGMIRAAAATEAAILTHRPDAVLNFGCAGAHRRDVRVGDVVIGTRSVAHATMVIDPDGVRRFNLHDGLEPPPPGETGIPSDPGLLQIAREVAVDWTPDAWHGRTGDTPSPQVLEGVIASADIWTQSHAGIDELAERHRSMCEDMEAAAIALVCALHDVPFLTIKDISNNELLQATIFDPELDYLPESEVGRRAATLTGRVIDAIATATRR